MMFKKKSNLPPRPNCPTTDQMIQDLMEVENDDPLFATVKSLVEKNLQTENMFDKDASYQKVQKLFASHDNLKDVMKQLNSTINNLNEKQSDIVKMSEDLKDQAIKALI